MDILHKARPYLDKKETCYASTTYIFTPTKTIQIQPGAAIIEHIRKNFKVNKSTLLGLSFTKTNLYIHENISNKKNILNIYQLNIFSKLLFLHRVKNGKTPNVFLSKFLRPSYHYPTRIE